MWMTTEPWPSLLQLARTPAGALKPSMVPTAPGVYVWFRDEEPVYAGKAAGAEGLRDRLSKHLASGLDLSRSSF